MCFLFSDRKTKGEKNPETLTNTDKVPGKYTDNKHWCAWFYRGYQTESTESFYKLEEEI